MRARFALDSKLLLIYKMHFQTADCLGKRARACRDGRLSELLARNMAHSQSSNFYANCGIADHLIRSNMMVLNSCTIRIPRTCVVRAYTHCSRLLIIFSDCLRSRVLSVHIAKTVAKKPEIRHNTNDNIATIIG